MISSSSASRFFVAAATAILMMHLSAAVAPIPGRWIEQSLPFTPRDKFGAVCENGTITVFGGRLSSTVYSNTMYKFDATAKRWTEIYATGLVSARFGGAMGKVGAHSYYFGGYLTGNVLNNDVWVYDPKTNFWQLAGIAATAVSVLPTPRGRLSSVVVDSKLFIFSGMTESQLSNEVWSFDTAWRTWTLEHTGEGIAPAPRFDTCCAYFAATTQTLCFGGTTDIDDVNDLWLFNHTDRSWAQVIVTGTVTTRPGPRRLAACAAINDNTLAVFSGWDSSISTFADGSTLYTFNLQTRRWAVNFQPASGGAPRRDSAVMCNDGSNNIYLLGGTGQTNSGIRLNDLWRLNSSTMQFTRVQAAASRPMERFGHTAAVVGEFMFVMFGSTGTALIFDPWALHIPTLQWTALLSSVTYADASSRASGREGASVVAKGNVLYFFGGTTANGLSDEFFAFNALNFQMKSITGASSLRPTPRAYHGAALYSGRMLIFGGLAPSATNSLFVFEFQSDTWLPVITHNNIAARSHFAFLSDPLMEDLVIIGGFGSTTLLDKWKVTGHQIDGTRGWNFTFTRLPQNASGLEARQMFRGEHTAVGYGSRYFICGGSISRSFPASRVDGCHEYNSVTGEHFVFKDPPEYIASRSTAVYYGRRMIIFGGEYASGAVKRGIPLSQMLVYEFDAAAMCPPAVDPNLVDESGDFGDAACLHCSPGTHNSGNQTACTTAPPGSFASRPYAAPELCSPGRYSAVRGANSLEACLLCPIGTFSDVAGAPQCKNCTGACAIGSINDMPGATVATVEAGFEMIQPERYTNPSIPLIIFVPIAGAVGGFIVIASFAICCSSRLKRKDRHFFFTAENRAELLKVFEKYDVPGYGIDESLIFNALMEPAVRVKPGFTLEIASTFFRQNDTDGSGFVDFKEFLHIIINLTVAGLCLPQPGSPSDAYLREHGIPAPQGFGRKLRSFQFSRFDMYLDGHRIGKMGDPIRLQRTDFGGMMSFTYIFLVLILVTALSLTFVYSNLFETRATMPIVVLQKEVSTTVTIEMTAIGGARLREHCVQPGTERACTGASASFIRGRATGAFVRNTGGCDWIAATSSCTLRVSFENFSIPTLSSDVFVGIFGPDIFAHAVEVRISFATGILAINQRDVQLSTGIVRMQPPNSRLVFRGWPAAQITTRLNPTFFTLEEPLVINGPRSGTGYHVQIVDVALGNTVDSTAFNQVFGVPIAVGFEVGDVALTVDRKPHQQALSFVSSVLGAVSGLSAGIITVVKFIDSRREKARQKAFSDEVEKHKNELAKSMSVVAGSSDDVGDDGKTMTTDEDEHDARRDRELIDPLVTGGVNIGVANQTLKLIRTVARDEMIKSNPALATTSGGGMFAKRHEGLRRRSLLPGATPDVGSSTPGGAHLVISATSNPLSVEHQHRPSMVVEDADVITA